MDEKNVIYSIIRKNIRNRGVNTLDLEIELADHILLAVEEKMKTGLSFYNSYKDVMLSFGPNGLEKLQNEKYNLLVKKGRKLVYKQFIEFITIPKIFLTLMIGAVLFTISANNFYLKEVFLSIIISLFVFTAINTFRIKIKYLKNNFSQIIANERLFSIAYYIAYIPAFIVFQNIAEINQVFFVIYLVFIIIIFFSYNVVMRKTVVEIEMNYFQLST